MIWKQILQPDFLQQKSKNTLIEHLNIQIEEIGPDFISASMPVDSRTKQPEGLLHGGASLVLAETLGSYAAWLRLHDTKRESVVGVEINASHLSPAVSGRVTGIVTPVRLGRRLQIWNILISQGEQKICICRFTTMTIKHTFTD